MGKIFAFANLKGGVGKTASAICLAGELAAEGKDVLLVDTDPQAGATISCGVDPAELTTSLFECLEGEVKPQKAILQTNFGADLLPANLDLALGDLQAATGGRGMNLEDKSFDFLKRILASLRASYDYVLIDTQPSFSRLTVGALVAADQVIIPVSCDVLGLRGLELMFRALRMVVVRLNSSLSIFGVLPTMYDARTLLSEESLEQMEDTAEGICPVFPPVKRSVRFQELPLAEGPIRDYAPEWGAPYQQLAEEVLSNE